MSRVADAPNLGVCKEPFLRSKFNYSGSLPSRHPPREMSRTFSILLLVLLKLDCSWRKSLLSSFKRTDAGSENSLFRHNGCLKQGVLCEFVLWLINCIQQMLAVWSQISIGRTGHRAGVQRTGQVFQFCLKNLQRKCVLGVKGKEIPLQAWTGSKVSRSLRFQDFKTIGTWRW